MRAKVSKSINNLIVKDMPMPKFINIDQCSLNNERRQKRLKKRLWKSLSHIERSRLRRKSVKNG
jgi:hypothetical protein